MGISQYRQMIRMAVTNEYRFGAAHQLSNTCPHENLAQFKHPPLAPCRDCVGTHPTPSAQRYRRRC